jgi:hypothetical protein
MTNQGGVSSSSAAQEESEEASDILEQPQNRNAPQSVAEVPKKASVTVTSAKVLLS